MSQHELQRLMPKHHTIVDLCLIGYGRKEIAQAVGMTPQGVSLVTQAPLFQSELARRREKMELAIDSGIGEGAQKARAIAERSAERAMLKQVEFMEDEDHSLAQRASKNILDTVFERDDSKKSQVVNISVENLNMLKIALDEATMMRGREFE